MTRYQMNNIKGVSMVEYALLAALIAVAAIVATTSIGTNLAAKFTTVATNLQ